MQKFRVTVDPESVTHLPIGTINLSSTLPGLALGAGDQIITGDQVVTDVGGNLLSTSGSVGDVESPLPPDTATPVTLTNNTTGISRTGESSKETSTNKPCTFSGVIRQIVSMSSKYSAIKLKIPHIFGLNQDAK